jgi:hypothetical protein
MKKILLLFLILIASLLVSCTTKEITDGVNHENIKNDAITTSIDNEIKEENQEETNDDAQIQEIKNEEETLIQKSEESDIEEEINLQEETVEESEELEIMIDPEKIAHFSLESNPSDAKVYVDKKYIGNTPINFDVEYGLKRLEIKKDNYVDYFLMTSINNGETKNMNIKLVKDVGYLDVTSEPNKAMIYLNGRYVGKTPMIANITAGETNLMLKYDGYETFNATVEIIAKKMTSINGVLVKK